MMAGFQIRADGHLLASGEDLGNSPGVLRHADANKTLLALAADPALAAGRQRIGYYAGNRQLPIAVDVAPEQYQKFITSSSSGKWGVFSRWSQYSKAKTFLETALTAGRAEGPDKTKVQNELAELKKIRLFSGGSKGKVLCFLARIVGDGHLPPDAARAVLSILAKKQNREDYNALTDTNPDYLALRAALRNIPAETELLAMIRSNSDGSRGVALLQRALRDASIESTLAQIPMDTFSRRAQLSAERVLALLANREALPADPDELSQLKESIAIFWGHLIAISTNENNYFAKLQTLFGCGSATPNSAFDLIRRSILFIPNMNYLYDRDDIEYLGSLYEQKLRGIENAIPTFFQPVISLRNGPLAPNDVTKARALLDSDRPMPYRLAFPIHVRDNAHWIGAILHVYPADDGRRLYAFQIFDSRLYAGYLQPSYLKDVVPRLTNLLGLPPTTPQCELRIPPYQQPITNGTHCGPCVLANFFRASLPPTALQNPQLIPPTNMAQLRWQQIRLACEARNDAFTGYVLQQSSRARNALERLLMRPEPIVEPIPLAAVTRLGAIYREEDAHL